MYLVAIIDWYSRKVLAWKLSNTMDVSFCLECLTDALSGVNYPGRIDDNYPGRF
jgi:putative transposase